MRQTSFAWLADNVSRWLARKGDLARIIRIKMFTFNCLHGCYIAL